MPNTAKTAALCLVIAPVAVAYGLAAAARALFYGAVVGFSIARDGLSFGAPRKPRAASEA